MKLSSAFWTITLFFFAISSATAAELDGFRGIKWGTSTEVFTKPGQEGVEGHMGAVPGVDAYRLRNEDLNFGGVKVDGIVYSFYNGKFTSVNIDFKGFDNMEKMLTYCKKLFGSATSSVTMMREYYASFDAPRTGALLVYQLSVPASSYGRLYLYSKEYLQ